MAITTELVIKLATAGPKLSQESELESFISYYDNIYEIPLSVEQIAITNALVRTKISGKPLNLVVANPQINGWAQWKTLLQNNLIDPRPMTTLIDTIATATLRGSVIEFYDYINSLRAKAVQRFRVDNPNATATEKTDNAAMISRIALNFFKKRINEPLRSILEMRSPTTLEAAMDILRSTSYDLSRRHNGQVETVNSYNNNYYNNHRQQIQNTHTNSGINSGNSIRSGRTNPSFRSNVNQWPNDNNNNAPVAMETESFNSNNRTGVNFRRFASDKQI